MKTYLLLLYVNNRNKDILLNKNCIVYTMMIDHENRLNKNVINFLDHDNALMKNKNIYIFTALLL